MNGIRVGAEKEVKKMIKHPIWFIWLMLNTIFAIIGGAVVSNQWNISFIPHIVAVLNLTFILCYFIETSKKE